MTAFRFFELVLLVVAGLLPIMNPFSTAPLLIALTAGMSAQERARQTLLGCLYAFGLLATFAIAGLEDNVVEGSVLPRREADGHSNAQHSAEDSF